MLDEQLAAVYKSLFEEKDITSAVPAVSFQGKSADKHAASAIEIINLSFAYPGTGNKTMLIIAHRLSTIEHCDIVYRAEDKKVVRER